VNKARKSISESYELLKQNGFNPATVIDVGVANGTPVLYNAFRNSNFFLVEPLVEFEEKIKTILERINGNYILAAAGSENKEVTINVHDDHLLGSSVLKEEMGAEADGYERVVPMVKLDDIIVENKLASPMLLKIDVQGLELEVLNGTLAKISDIEVIVLEVSLFRFMKESPDFYDVIYYMKQIGYVTYDIIFGWNRPLDNALGQVDIMFVKEKGFLRRDHSFSSVEQLQLLIEK
jgi:FkbM family methyltransferase